MIYLCFHASAVETRVASIRIENIILTSLKMDRFEPGHDEDAACAPDRNTDEGLKQRTRKIEPRRRIEKGLRRTLPGLC